jgi:hypothetical protein
MEKWFARKRKSEVLELADRRMTLAIETVNDPQKTIQAGLEGDKKAPKTTLPTYLLSNTRSTNCDELYSRSSREAACSRRIEKT